MPDKYQETKALAAASAVQNASADPASKSVHVLECGAAAPLSIAKLTNSACRLEVENLVYHAMAIAFILRQRRVTQREGRSQSVCIRVRAIPGRVGAEAMMDEQSRAPLVRA